MRRDTWVPPYIALFCRAGPVCPAVGAGKTRSGRCGHRPLRKRILRCVGEGLCPSRGRGRTPPLRKHNKRCNGRATARVAPTEAQQEVQRAGRCGERIERRRWRMKRDERVAAVKILSVRRKAAQKFWAPQQDHRPLRMCYKECGGAGGVEPRPYGRLQEVRGVMPGRRWWGCCSRVYRHPRGGGGCGW